MIMPKTVLQNKVCVAKWKSNYDLDRLVACLVSKVPITTILTVDPHYRDNSDLLLV